MQSGWYYSQNGNARGPISRTELRTMLERGELRQADLVWRVGMAEWVPASQLVSTELAAVPPPRIDRSPSVPVTPSHPGVPGSSAPPAETHRRSASQVTARRVTLAVITAGIVVLNGVWLWHASYMTTPTPHAQRTSPAGRENGVAEADGAAKAPPLESAPTAHPKLQAKRPELAVPDSDHTSASQRPAAPQPAPHSVALEATDQRLTDGEIQADHPLPTAARPPQPVAQPHADNKTPALPPPAASAAPRVESRYQDVDIQRRPAFRVAGLVNSQFLHYRLLSRLELEPPDQAGVRRVTQFVEETQLIAADDVSRESFAKSLERLKKQQFTYELTNRGEVVHFAGHKENVAELAFDLASAKGLMVTSVIDGDGWKELAELTFFVPDTQAKTGQKWRRQLAHDWRSLGKWSGATTYIKRTPRAGLVPIDFVREMTFKPGTPGAGFATFQVRDARFVAKEAAGAMQFNTGRERVDVAREVFDVAGVLQVELFGQVVAVELSERQELNIRVTDQKP